MGATRSKIRVWALRFCRALCKCSFTHPKISNRITLFLIRGAGSNLLVSSWHFREHCCRADVVNLSSIHWLDTLQLLWVFFLHLITGRLLACLIALASLAMGAEKAVDHLNCSGGLSQGWSASPPCYDQIKQAKALFLVGTPCQLLCSSAPLLRGTERCKSLCDGGRSCAHSSWGERTWVESFCSHPGCRAATTSVNSVITSLSLRDSKCSLKPSSKREFGMTF